MKPIVVGVDESKASAAALRWAVQIARPLGVRVRAVTVLTSTGWMINPEFGGWCPFEPGTRDEEGRALLDRAVRSAVPVDDLWRIDRRAVVGVASWSLVEESTTASMVVIGAKRRNAITRLMDGSIQPALLRHASCPVVVVPEHHEIRTPVVDLVDRELVLAG